MTVLQLKQFAQRTRVPLGFVLAPLFLIFAAPTVASILTGAMISVLGLGFRAWASGHLRKMAELTTSGPYAHTRNPLYFGTFLMVLGGAIAGGQWWVALIIAASYLFIYVPVMLAEIDTMRNLFPSEYDQWAMAVPLFFPRVTPAASSNGARRFDIQLYLKHREYQATLGLLGIFAVLAIKMFVAR